jgi:outer membrane autotransporter protein
MALRTKNHTLPKRLAISAAVATTFLAGYGVRPVYAGSCTGAAGTYTCSGAANAGTDTTQTLNSGASPLTVTTTTGFGIVTTNNVTINLKNTAGGTSINFIDANTSTITGYYNGIYARNFGAGATSITSTGTVTGTNYYGIFASNSAASSNITISTFAVTGGNAGIKTDNFGKGTTSITSTGAVTGTYNIGIYAANDLSATSLTINTAAVTGSSNGIIARNAGTGITSITSTGAVTGTTGRGIYAYNSSTASTLTISTAAVTGGGDGIFASNNGTGATSITSTGVVTGTNGSGIYAQNNLTPTDLTINTAAVTGSSNGILAKNFGSGATSVTSTGTVTSAAGNGIVANNGYYTTGLTINTAAVTGKKAAISVSNQGSGATSVTSTGTVTATNYQGIRVFNNNTATNLTINTAAVTGNTVGIDAQNNGTGATSITSTGTVTATGRTRKGISAYNGSAATNLTINTAAVTGGSQGIYARNYGTGATSITSTGTVTGTTSYGIYAYNGIIATNLTINTAAVTSGSTGIYARNFGTGATSITSTGLVTSPSNNGIQAYNASSASTLTINTAAVTAGTTGIYAKNFGKGATSITVSGAVNGGGGKGVAGIYSYANYGNTITLNSGASVSATNGDAITLAGKGSKGAATNGVTVNTGASVTGSVNLNGITNTMTLNGGTLNAANGFALNVLGHLINTNGIINLRNGSSISAPATVAGNFTGGGQLLLNANFATDTADKLNITGNVLAGGTSVGVNDVSTGPATGNAITLVSVGGTTTAGDFTLAAPVARGAFNYNTLALVGSDWVLQSVAATSVGGNVFTPFAGSFEVLGQSLLTVANLPTLIDRTYGRIGGIKTGANSGDSTGLETPIWLRLTGGYRDIDSNSSSTGASFNTKHWQTQVGIDFPLAENASGRFVGGINAAYNQAKTDVSASAGNSNLDTTGYSVGASGTWYGANAVYVDAQLQRSWYDTDLSAGGVGAGKVKGVGSDGYSASIEAGKEIALNNSLRITPQAQLMYATVDTDDFTGANAEIVKLSTSKSLRARLGAVLKKYFTEDGATYGYVQAHVTREFDDKTNVNVSSAALANVVDRWSGQLGVGLSHAWVKGATSYELTGAVTGSTSLNNLGDSTAAQGQVNFKVTF